jgi:hypothetical protein
VTDGDPSSVMMGTCSMRVNETERVGGSDRNCKTDQCGSTPNSWHATSSLWTTLMLELGDEFVF